MAGKECLRCRGPSLCACSSGRSGASSRTTLGGGKGLLWKRTHAWLVSRGVTDVRPRRCHTQHTPSDINRKPVEYPQPSAPAPPVFTVVK